MNEELKEKLSEALKNAGLPKALLSNLNVEEEGDIKGVIDNLKAMSTPKPLTEEEIIKNPVYRAYADKRVSEAKKKWGKPEPPKPEPPIEGLTAEAIAKIVEDAQAPLKKQLETLTGQRTLESKKSEASKLIQNSKLSDFEKKKALSRIDFNSETSVQEQIESLEDEESERLQFLADNGRLADAPPSLGGGSDLTDEQAEAIAERQNIN